MKKLLVLLGFCFLINSDFNKISAQEPVYKNTDRFVLLQLSDFRRDQYILDTSTGKAWNLIMNSDSVNVFKRMYYTDENGKISITPNPSDVKNYIGRYKLKQISEYRRDQYLIDTETGKIWNVVSSEEHGQLLQAMPFE